MAVEATEIKWIEAQVCLYPFPTIVDYMGYKRLTIRSGSGINGTRFNHNFA